ncbi:target of Myb1 membrane trafficking protein isoform X2 [Bemisia tabaci]|uniref:target of Myb1 membrane trafficking protein isoform X2 n=1 Tax=Bemisia tabaci TaxID=7038 RepID=UPI0008F9CEF9|nr:PREDICTED: target of Myb protein 1 isoform X2 [Bemisia tabaci]
MTSFFGVGISPFSTPVGQRIERATDAALPDVDWSLNLEICDLINEREDGPKDAIKAIRKRLVQNAGKNHTVVKYTLIVLETCVKNCGKRFHVLVCNKEFVQELVKLIGPKNDPPTEIQDKVLSMIQSWTDAFKNQPEMSGVVQVYTELKTKGIEFPMTDLDTMAPILTPHKSVDSDIPVGVVATETPKRGSAHQHVSAAPGSHMLTPEQMVKLQSELDLVNGNMTVLNEMLTELTPGKEHPSDIQLLEELYGTCRAMQERLAELISRLANDELTAELLRINDLLNNLFLRYNRFVSNREGVRGEGEGAKSKVKDEPDALIDLSDEATSGSSNINAQMAAMTLSGATAIKSQLSSVPGIPAKIHQNSNVEEDSAFDMFAQSRNKTYESSKVDGSSYEANLKPDQVASGLGAFAQNRSQPAIAAMHKESDFDEMAAWLGANPGSTEESLTSSEFESFLAERAAAAEASGTTTTTNSTNVSSSLSNSQQSSSPRHRSRSKKELDESNMFAL